MTLTKASARPLLCGGCLAVCAGLMFVGLFRLGTTEVVPAWFQAMTGIAWAWFFRDRTLAHERGERDTGNVGTPTP